jgi:uncharacterized DUF497 family protein
MGFYYDPGKAEKLLKERSINLEEIVDILSADRYLKMLENKSRPEQNIFILRYKGYIHVVPFIFDIHGNHVIKTAYPSRKYNKIFGGKNEA